MFHIGVLIYDALSGGAVNPRVWFITVVPVIAIAFLIIHYPPQHFGIMETAGLLLAVGGIGLLTLARLQLGNSFSVTPQAKQLVTTGLYSRVRNPIYVFSTLGVSGLALYFDKPILLLGLLLLIPLQVSRAKAEERVLLQKFGDDYLRYKASTWF